MGARVLETFVIKERLIVKAKRKLRPRNALRMGNKMGNEAKLPWRVLYTWHLWFEMRNATTFLQCCRNEDCCAMHMPTRHSS